MEQVGRRDCAQTCGSDLIIVWVNKLVPTDRSVSLFGGFRSSMFKPSSPMLLLPKSHIQITQVHLLERWPFLSNEFLYSRRPNLTFTYLIIIRLHMLRNSRLLKSKSTSASTKCSSICISARLIFKYTEWSREQLSSWRVWTHRSALLRMRACICLLSYLDITDFEDVFVYIVAIFCEFLFVAKLRFWAHIIFVKDNQEAI